MVETGAACVQICLRTDRVFHGSNGLFTAAAVVAVTAVARPVRSFVAGAGLAGLVRYVYIELFAGLPKSWGQSSCIPDLAGALCLYCDCGQSGGQDDEWGMTRGPRGAAPDR